MERPSSHPLARGREGPLAGGGCRRGCFGDGDPRDRGAPGASGDRVPDRLAQLRDRARTRARAFDRARESRRGGEDRSRADPGAGGGLAHRGGAREAPGGRRRARGPAPRIRLDPGAPRRGGIGRARRGGAHRIRGAGARRPEAVRVMPMGLLAYRGAAALTGWCAPLLRGFGARGSAWRSAWSGATSDLAAASGSVWVHAASMGEVVAARTWIQALLDSGHRAPILLTTRTSRGLARARRELTDRVVGRIAPLDLPQLLRSFLEGAAPWRLDVVETELWPHPPESCSEACGGERRIWRSRSRVAWGSTADARSSWRRATKRVWRACSGRSSAPGFRVWCGARPTAGPKPWGTGSPGWPQGPRASGSLRPRGSFPWPTNRLPWRSWAGRSPRTGGTTRWSPPRAGRPSWSVRTRRESRRASIRSPARVRFSRRRGWRLRPSRSDRSSGTPRPSGAWGRGRFAPPRPHRSRRGARSRRSSGSG